MIPASVRILVCTKPQDMRRSFDGLAMAAHDFLGEDPKSGALFVFVNKRANRLKVLWWDDNGYCLLYKRVHGSLFRLPISGDAGRPSVKIDGRQLARIIRGVPKPARRKLTQL